RKRVVRLAAITMVITVIGLVVVRFRPYLPLPDLHVIGAPVSGPARIVVRPTDSISQAIEQAEPGSEVVVEPGEYHEALVLKSGVRVVSRVPRGATIRLAGSATEAESAVVASAADAAEIAGFRIVGDAATPLGTGLFIKSSALSIIDVEVTGAANVAIDISDTSSASILASDIHDNPGAALAIRSGASPRIAHNVFMRNGMSERVQGSFIIDENVDPHFSANVFQGVSREAFGRLANAARDALGRDNWFLERLDVRSTTSLTPRD